MLDLCLQDMDRSTSDEEDATDDASKTKMLVLDQEK